MIAPTIRGLVDQIHLAATEQGMDLSLSDVAFIISSFLEGIAHASPTDGAGLLVQALADEVNQVTDED